ncbi:MAG: nucleoside 2-deoxyribosyltransferase [Rhodospirillales bacterium]|nr:nucleoside 2-deoxyribosyltransferase [Rhodospirillales bacterium]
MIVAGGLYREECLSPVWSRIFGSGGRAAAAVSQLSPGTILHAYGARQWADDARYSMEAFGVAAAITEIDADISFTYFHPLSTPELHPDPIIRQPPLKVAGEVVLRFGFVEGDVVVSADRVVYDPQHWDDVLRFHENGSQAGTLAIVLNEKELQLSTGQYEEADGAQALMARTGANIVVVKRGPRGAVVYDGELTAHVPAYVSESVFKIGSGDIFSAAFALGWAEQRLTAVEAADAASRAVAHYVASRSALLLPGMASIGEAAPDGTVGSIYLAAPFFNLGQRWVVEESVRALKALGATVFSPLHDVGTHGNAMHIASKDLEGLRSACAVLAILDGEDAGTLFEVGYARDRSIPVVVLAEAPRPESLTMLVGSGCRVVRDLTTAIYHAIWAATK